MYDTLNKCMDMILNADKSISKKNYSHFKKNQWCLLKEIEDMLFEDNKFKLNISFTNNGLTPDKFNFESLMKDDDISSFFILFHKIQDMCNMLIILSNILRNNNKQVFLYDWVPKRDTFTTLDATSDNLLSITLENKQYIELTIHNTIMLINQINTIELFFYEYAFWMQHPMGIEANSNPTRTKGPFIPQSFTSNNKKIVVFCYYLTGQNIEKICNNEKYKIQIPFLSNNVAGTKYQTKKVSASANRASASANGASANGASASANEIIRVTENMLTNNSKKGTKKRNSHNKGASAEEPPKEPPKVVYPLITPPSSPSSWANEWLNENN